MFNHITPPSSGSDHNDQAAEPPHSRRFDERGIALQTIIILVVLLAIAGAVVVVIANRAAEETGRLEDTEDRYSQITDLRACQLAGGVAYEPGKTDKATDPDAAVDCKAE